MKNFKIIIVFGLLLTAFCFGQQSCLAADKQGILALQNSGGTVPGGDTTPPPLQKDSPPDLKVVKPETPLVESSAKVHRNRVIIFGEFCVGLLILFVLFLLAKKDRKPEDSE